MPGVFDYYLTLERTSANTSKLSIYADAARTAHIPGSPVSVPIDANITGLNTIQHAASTPGNANRYFNGRIDNDLICLASNSLNEELDQKDPLIEATVFPNPSSNYFEISISDYSLIKQIIVRDLAGKTITILYPIDPEKNNFQLPETLGSGNYFLEIINQHDIQIVSKIQKLQQ